MITGDEIDDVALNTERLSHTSPGQHVMDKNMYIDVHAVQNSYVVRITYEGRYVRIKVLAQGVHGT